MTDPFLPEDTLQELEELLSSAGNYMQPSPDLRPRVLEAVRAEQGERWLRGWIQQAAIVLLLLGSGAAALQSRTSESRTSESLTSESWSPQSPDASIHSVRYDRLAPGGDTFLSTEIAARGGDPNWSMVESLTRLRRRQAQILGCDL